MENTVTLQTRAKRTANVSPANKRRHHGLTQDWSGKEETRLKKIQSYPKVYVEDAASILGEAFHFSVNVKGRSLTEFLDRFIHTGYARRFENGDPCLVTGCSGPELWYFVEGRIDDDVDRSVSVSYSPEYWAGWALAQYQHTTARSFDRILRRVRVDDIVRMYHPYHECGIDQFIEEMDRRFEAHVPETRLAELRGKANLSQSELAEKSGVNLRSIQMYEQRVNDIDKAQGRTLCRLAKALYCRVEDLLEDPFHD